MLGSGFLGRPSCQSVALLLQLLDLGLGFLDVSLGFIELFLKSLDFLLGVDQLSYFTVVPNDLQLLNCGQVFALDILASDTFSVLNQLVDIIWAFATLFGRDDFLLALDLRLALGTVASRWCRPTL